MVKLAKILDRDSSQPATPEETKLREGMEPLFDELTKEEKLQVNEFVANLFAVKENGYSL